MGMAREVLVLGLDDFVVCKLFNYTKTLIEASFGNCFEIREAFNIVLPVLLQSGDSAVILVASPLVLHPSVHDRVHRDIHVVAAHHLQELLHL